MLQWTKPHLGFGRARCGPRSKIEGVARRRLGSNATGNGSRCKVTLGIALVASRYSVMCCFEYPLAVEHLCLRLGGDPAYQQ